MTTALRVVPKCVTAYISEKAPVYADVSVHMLEWVPRRITGICGCLCVRVGGCVRRRETERVRSHARSYAYQLHECDYSL